MSDKAEKKEADPDPLDGPVGLYHEAQADGVPYADSSDDFATRNYTKPPFMNKH